MTELIWDCISYYVFTWFYCVHLCLVPWVLKCKCTLLFIISGPIGWNWYSSANKRYFCAKIWLFVVLIIPHTICSKMTFTVRRLLCMTREYILSAWDALDQPVIDTAVKQWRTHFQSRQGQRRLLWTQSSLKSPKLTHINMHMLCLCAFEALLWLLQIAFCFNKVPDVR